MSQDELVPGRRFTMRAPPTSLQSESDGSGECEEQPSAIVGESAAIRRVLAVIDGVAPTPSAVLLLGETGTGKELLADALHDRSPRRGRALVKVNCAAIVPSLIESELFGHERGAFTGALQRRVGCFELAHGGTLFLDEIGELPFDAQAKLLRVLQEGEIERVGGSRTIPIDVRIVCATNRDLQAEILKGRFRSDLFYRLSVFPIRVPPLRERCDDVPLLIDAFFRSLGERLGHVPAGVDETALALLCSHTWPGNVRELHNVLERAAILAGGRAIRPEDLPDLDLPSNTDASPAQGTLKQRVDWFERSLIEDALRKSGWNQSAAARRLQLSRATLAYKMKVFGLS
jgi:transcriptional regulator with GAF, ATPase, and Fis domain